MSASRAAVRLVFSFRLTLLWTLLCWTQYCERVYADGLSVTEVRNGRDRHLQAEQSSSTIFGNSLEPGWTVQSAGVTTQQVRGAVNNGSQAFCASFAAAKVRNCMFSLF